MTRSTVDGPRVYVRGPNRPQSLESSVDGHATARVVAGPLTAMIDPSRV